MHVETLTLSSFRNFSFECFEFGTTFNIFIGANAQGKTNILESLVFLSRGRSFRTADHRDLIKHDQAQGRVEARIIHRAGFDRWRAELMPEKKILMCNEKRWRGREKRHFCAILFSPEEILLLRDSPGARREYLDDLIARFVPAHDELVHQYGRVVSARNALLKDPSLSRQQLSAQLEPWDHQLISLGSELVWRRDEWIGTLNRDLAPQYRALGTADGEASFHYVPFCGPLPSDLRQLEQLFTELLQQRSEDELVRRMSLVGPHRDDLIAALGSKPIKRFGSQGQHRSFILALKMAEMELYYRQEGEWPLFLLDDVASELDRQRNSAFFEYLNRFQGQVFVTTTDAQTVLLKECFETRVFAVADGAATVKGTSKNPAFTGDL